MAVETVYKYCGAFGADVLRHLELKITPPNQFNDQFEFTPKIICSDPCRWAKRTLTRDHVRATLYEALRSEGQFTGSFVEFQQSLKQQQAKWIDYVAKSVLDESWLEEEGMRFLNEVSGRWGILCLSGSRDSVLMWGHYCDKPLGLVIGFDKSAPIFQKAKAMQPVDYVKERVVFDMCWERDSPELADYENRIIFSKSIEWDNEQELRQAFELRDLLRRPLGASGAFGYFLPIAPETIVSVTLGPRCSSDQEGYVREILTHSPSLRGCGVKLDRACVTGENFKLRFEPLPW